MSEQDYMGREWVTANWWAHGINHEIPYLSCVRTDSITGQLVPGLVGLKPDLAEAIVRDHNAAMESHQPQEQSFRKIAAESEKITQIWRDVQERTALVRPKKKKRIEDLEEGEQELREKVAVLEQESADLHKRLDALEKTASVQAYLERVNRAMEPKGHTHVDGVSKCACAWGSTKARTYAAQLSSQCPSCGGVL